MTRKIFYGVASVIFSMAISSGSCSKEKPLYEGPHLSFEIDKVDFGEMEQQSEANKEVVFKNTGNATLEIKDVQSSCGCTAAIPTDRTIEPGEKGILNVSFKSGKSVGDVEKVITVVTNDSINPRTRLPVKAFVKTDIKLEPRSIDFGEVQLGESKTAEARLMSQNGKPFEILFVEVDSSQFDYSIKPVEEDGNPGYIFELTLKPTRKPQSFYKVVNLRTDNTRLPVFRLPVVAKILGNMRIEPRTVLLRGVMGGEEQSAKVTIETLGDARVKLLGTETTKGIVSVNTRTLEEEASYEITVSYTPDKPGRQKDYLVVSTDDEFEPEVRIPITIFTAKQEITASKGVPSKGSVK